MKKGFTLIELLAVILILGIIALIAIPTVNNIISEAKEAATERSAEQYIKAVEQAVTVQEMKGHILAGTMSVNDLKDIVELKGTLPSSGNVTIENNTVTACSLTIEDYSITCNGENLTITKGEKVSPQLVVDNNHNGVADINDKVCIGEECFYVISKDSTKTRMLAEWNLNVGYDLSYNGSDIIPLGIGVTGSYNSTYQAKIRDDLTYTKLNPSVIKQDSTKRGWVYNENNNSNQFKGIVSFAKQLTRVFDSYWVDDDYNLLPKYGNKSWDEIRNSEDFPYVYDENSNLYPYINSYVETLKNMTGNTNITGNLITYDELISLGCDGYGETCESAPSYVYQTSYWSGTAVDFGGVWAVSSFCYGSNEFGKDKISNRGIFSEGKFFYISSVGVRPVIEIPTLSIE